VRDNLGRIADAWGTSKQRQVLNDIYPTLEKISVDFAVMEPASADDQFQVCTINMKVKWTDIGSWPSYGETLTADAHGNRTNTATEHLDASNVLAVSHDPDHVIATIGCENLIIVHTKDVTLVCRADQAQRVKELAERVDPSLQ
jgi:mannose-1-phosphate guanylyltransferase